MKSKTSVGIITYHGADNYGSVLQAFALQKTIAKFPEIDCNVINYISEAQKQMYGIYFKNNSIKNLLKNAYIFLFQRNVRLKKKKSFDSFRRERLTLLPVQSTVAMDELQKDAYDVLICGSDQIWNVSIPDFSPLYMLNGLNGEKKISYAASMGGLYKEFSDEQRKKIKGYLNSFDGISVRENVAKKMLQECGIHDIAVHLDPTFLVDKKAWISMMSNQVRTGDYIFFYSVDYNEESVNIARWYSKHFHMPVVTMYTSWRSYFICRDGIDWSGKTGVEDFLSLVYHAKFVLSGSFHGTVFSLIFNKPFFRIQKTNNGERVIDDRVKSLFSHFDIEDREISISDYKEKADRIFDIDFETINRKIEYEKRISIEYLKTMFKEIAEQ